MWFSLFLAALPIVILGIHLDVPEQQPLIAEHSPGTIYQVLSSNIKSLLDFRTLTSFLHFNKVFATYQSNQFCRRGSFIAQRFVRTVNNSTSPVTHSTFSHLFLASLSFFAPPDSALPHHKDDLMLHGLSPDFDTYETCLPGPTDLAEALRLLDILDFSKSQPATDEYDDEKRKKILKFILRAILEYHIIPTAAYDIINLGHNSTYPTSLIIPGVLDSQPQRLRVEQTIIPPRTSINFYTKIIRPNVKASNGKFCLTFVCVGVFTMHSSGIIHVVNYPLLPPPSIFQGLYMVPHFFSTFVNLLFHFFAPSLIYLQQTSALQRSGLTEALDFRYIHHKGFEGSRLMTAFAPTNRAFEALPKNLQLFLFSPFGEKALKKILSYHVVPNVVVHSGRTQFHVSAKNRVLNRYFLDYLRTEHKDKSSPTHSVYKFHEPTLEATAFPLPKEPISSVNLTLNTLFVNHTLQAEIMREKITLPLPWPGHKKPYAVRTVVSINHQLVLVPDIVGLNGAAHVIGKILDPRACHYLGPVDSTENEDVWDKWEEWLPQWADEIL